MADFLLKTNQFKSIHVKWISKSIPIANWNALLDSISRMSYYLDSFFSCFKHIVDDNYVFQQHNTPTRDECNTAQLLQCKTLNLISSELWPLTAQNWTQWITRFRGSYSSMRMICRWTRLEKSSSNWLNSGKAVIQHLSEKMQFSCFHILPHRADALFNCGGNVNHHLVTYIFRNISARN